MMITPRIDQDKSGNTHVGKYTVFCLCVLSAAVALALKNQRWPPRRAVALFSLWVAAFCFDYGLLCS